MFYTRTNLLSMKANCSLKKQNTKTNCHCFKTLRCCDGILKFMSRIKSRSVEVSINEFINIETKYLRRQLQFSVGKSSSTTHMNLS